MTKTKLLDALRLSEEQNKPISDWWDEFVTLTALVANASTEAIDEAWNEVDITAEIGE
ncbi:hypothetical protein FACS1894188_10770 [Clostridia bacterium]|nr:hypothetical protein FACS1894188_10770 [Clostridia bacterium]